MTKHKSINDNTNPTQLHETDLSKTNFSGANLSGKDFSDKDLTGADFSGANLTEANFTNANLDKANFTHADCSGAVFSGADLCNADFSHSNLYDATMLGAYAQGTNFRKANLDMAFLNGTDLHDADFSCANLAGAVFRGTYLHNTNFRRAWLCHNTSLEDASFMNTQFEETLWGENILINREPLWIKNVDNNFPVVILDDHMVIRGSTLTFAEWESLNNASIRMMDDKSGYEDERKFSKFWADWKEPLLAMCEARKTTINHSVSDMAA